MSKKIEKLCNTSFSSNNEYLVYMFEKLIVCTIIMYLLIKPICFKKKNLTPEKLKFERELISELQSNSIKLQYHNYYSSRNVSAKVQKFQYI